jgi:hypothetical protein
MLHDAELCAYVEELSVRLGDELHVA